MALVSALITATLLTISAAYPLANNNSACSTLLDSQLPNNVPSDFTFSGNIRRYYIAAEQITWNYAPTGWDNALGVPIEDSPQADAAGYTSPGSLGMTWQKALYREYTDATFTQESERAPWLGNTGPILRAEVGDMIEILFVNRLPGLFASMHSMGLAYSKGNEGSLYPNTTGVMQENMPAYGDKVPPGGCVVYKWLVNDGSSPTHGTTSHVWGYHSFVSMEQDQNAGLTGSTIVYSRGQMEATMSKYREFVLIYMNFDESKSSMSAVNRATLLGLSPVQPNASHWPTTSNSPGNESTWQPQVTNWLAGSNQLTSTQAPTFMALNGLVLQNNALFEMCINDPTMWYVSSFGTASHVFHMHGNGFVYNGDNLASISINDGEMMTLNSTMSGVGQWDLICHVNNHYEKGMMDQYVVYPADSCPLSPLNRV